MPNEKKKQPFSRLNSIYLSCRRHLSCSIRPIALNPTRVCKKLPFAPQNIIRSSSNSPSLTKNQPNDSVEGSLRRVCDLETELLELEEWFCSELTRLKSHLGSTIDTNNIDGACNYSTNSNNERADNKFERLDCEQGYLYTFNGNKSIDGIYQHLSIQISGPALVPPEPGFSNISEILSKMEEMGKENLIAWLLNSMPMISISANNTKGGLNINSCTKPNNLLEAILMTSIDKLQELVIQGLQIQMGTKQMVKLNHEGNAQATTEARNNKVDHEGGESTTITIMVLIQHIDPQREYEPVNDMMIGLIEATNVEISQDIGFMIKGVHVAGLAQVNHNCLWCLSA